MNFPVVITINEERFELAGTFEVDAGICWIGDPCYVLHKQVNADDIGTDWASFCHRLLSRMTNGVSRFSHGFVPLSLLCSTSDPAKTPYPHAGLGVCVSTGYGDGYYPVYVRRKDNRVMEVFIDFDPPPLEEDEGAEIEDNDALFW